MGKVIAPLHSFEVRGQVAGIVYRRWRDLNTVGAPGGNEGDGSQAQFISWMAACAQWGVITSAQRSAWRIYASGIELTRGPLHPKKRSGYITYAMAAYLAGQCGESYPTAPPTTRPPNFPITMNFQVSGGKLYIEWDPDQDGDYIELKWRVNAPGPVKIFDYRLGLVGYFAIATEDYTGPTALTGKNNRARLRVVRSNGQVGPARYASLET